MIYKIRYFQGDKHLADVPWDDTKADPIAVVRDGLIRHSATMAVVLDDGGKEVATVHAQRP